MEMLRVVDGPEQLVDVPAYTPTAVARYLRLPVSTVRWWTLGNGSHLPVIRIAAPHEHLLSFRNLTEVHVLSAVMCQDRDRVPLSIVRAVLSLLSEQFGSVHPLVDKRMDDEGKELFAARFGAITQASRHGQAALAAILGTYLERIERDERGAPSRLLIFTRGRPEGPEHVMIDPAVQSGQPCITDTSIATAIVADRFRGGQTVMDLARHYSRTRDEIEEAIRYEAEVK